MAKIDKAASGLEYFFDLFSYNKNSPAHWIANKKNEIIEALDEFHFDYEVEGFVIKTWDYGREQEYELRYKEKLKKSIATETTDTIDDDIHSDREFGWTLVETNLVVLFREELSKQIRDSEIYIMRKTISLKSHEKQSYLLLVFGLLEELIRLSKNDSFFQKHKISWKPFEVLLCRIYRTNKYILEKALLENIKSLCTNQIISPEKKYPENHLANKMDAERWKSYEPYFKIPMKGLRNEIDYALHVRKTLVEKNYLLKMPTDKEAVKIIKDTYNIQTSVSSCQKYKSGKDYTELKHFQPFG